MKNYSTVVLAAATALVLAACGGGGGDGGTPANTLYAVNAAQRHLLVEGGTWTMTGTAPSGGAVSVTVALSPLAAALPISGNTAYPRTRQLFTVQGSGVAPAVIGQNLFFDSASLAIVQATYDDGTCSVPTANTAMPASATLGASGASYVLNDLDGCTSNAPSTGTTITTWALENDAGVALLCWNSAARDTAGAVLASLSSCFEVAPDGALGAKARLTSTALGLSFTVRNY